MPVGIPHSKECGFFHGQLVAIFASLAAILVGMAGTWWPAALCGAVLLLWDFYKSRIAAVATKKRRRNFMVCQATMDDVRVLSEIYAEDYVACHRTVHRRSPAGAAAAEEWEAALGPVDFKSVLEDVIANKGGGEVRLLKCVEVFSHATSTSPDGGGACNATSNRPVGYVLYELRQKFQKGPKKRPQRFCELVNIVVRQELRGAGAGRCLFEAFCKNLQETASQQAEDIRLFVAESNVEPIQWYRRLGFRDAGFQSEQVGGQEVKFVRMIRKP